MQIEPDEGTGIDDYVVVEEGTYPLRVESIKETNNADGDISWMLRMALVEGERAGRVAVTDWMNFSERGMHRVRSVLGALGWDVSVPVDVEARELEGRVANVRLINQESTHPETGRVQRRSRVPYDGWSPCPDAERFASAGSVDVRSGASHGGSGVGLAADAVPF